MDDGYLSAQLPLLAGLGSITSRIRLLTNCAILPLHQWRMLVEGAIVTDLVTEGRFDLGVALGGFEREYQLFSVPMRERARLMEEGLKFVRQGLHEGALPDGPGGELVPVTPRPVQARIPLLVGGIARPAVDRAVRLADGILAFDSEAPERNLPAYWEAVLRPLLDEHGRSLNDFRFVAIVALWASDDPERDWSELIRPGLDYQQRKYAEWSGRFGEPGYVRPEELKLESQLVDTPGRLAARLGTLHQRCPWHELVFWYRLPGVSHEQGMQQLETVARRLAPTLGSATPATREVPG